MGLDAEQIRPIEGAPGYFATSGGRILSSHFSSQKMREKIDGLHELRPAFTGNGYGRVVLSVGGAYVTRLVHRLIAIAFSPGQSAGFDVRHLDGNPRNNEASNLAWGTRTENMRDAVGHGRTMRGSKSHLAKIDEAIAAEVHRLMRSGMKNTPIAKAVGCPLSTVEHIRAGNSWTHLSGEA